MSARKSVNSCPIFGKSIGCENWKNGALLSLNICRKPLVLEPVKMVLTRVLFMSKPVRSERMSGAVPSMRASS